MIDQGLLISIVLVVCAVWAVSRRWPPRLSRDEPILSSTTVAVLVGIATARLASVALDDPAALSRPRDLLIIRGGMEFWPGVVAAMAATAWAARRAKTPVFAEIADLAPYALLASGVYEAACVLRDGCFGPSSSIGLRPAGSGPTELPIGLAVAAATMVLAVAVRRVGAERTGSAVLTGVAGLAAIRAVAAIWLPRIGSGLSRSQIESIAVLIGAFVAALLSIPWRATAGFHNDGPATSADTVS